MDDSGLVYVGKIIDMQPIPGADFIVSATVVCGIGGKWKGVVRKGAFQEDLTCIVYLPDALISESEDTQFMKATGWRVKMRRFKGAPSEVVIMPTPHDIRLPLGSDITRYMNVTKYHKPVPANLIGIAKGDFPSFIPKTDEPNYQTHSDLIDKLVGHPFYITEKCDGSSTTAFRYKRNFGVCSRNLELERNEENGYWKVALRYGLEEKLPEGYAIQWETCGPKIQKNSMGLNEINGFVFSGYNIDEHRYLTFSELFKLCNMLEMPMVRIIKCGNSFNLVGLDLLGEGTYENGQQREGVVVRSHENFGAAPISFKVINLNYET